MRTIQRIKIKRRPRLLRFVERRFPYMVIDSYTGRVVALAPHEDAALLVADAINIGLTPIAPQAT